MIPHSMLYIYIKRKDIHFKETLGCLQLLFILVELQEAKNAVVFVSIPGM